MIKFVLVAFLSCFSLAVHAFDYASIAVFGDSMTDGGDDATAVDSYYKRYGNPFPPVGGAPNVPTTGFRFAEDLTWPEYMAQYQGLFDTTTFFNWSVGGQRITDFNPVLDEYFVINGSADPNRLYVIALGQVDILYGESTPEELSSVLVTRIQRLYDNGARQFLVLNSMYAGDLPANKDETEEEKTAATNITIDFNTRLANKIDALSFANDIRIFDLGNVVNQLKTDGPLHGFTETFFPCIETAETGDFCADITGYLFWDVVHVSSQTQRVVADLIDSSIQTDNNLSVAVTLPKNNVSYPENTAITVTALALDNNAAIDRVEFYDNGVLIETDSTAPYTISWQPAVTGAHSVTAQAFNSDGVSVTSRVTTVDIAGEVNSAPTVTLNQPVADAGNVNGSIEATASDSDGSISRVEFYINGGLFATVDTAPYQLEWTGAPSGTYDVFVKAYDNEELSTDSNVVTIVIDETLGNQAPVVTLAEPVGNAGNKQGSITATASDPDGTIDRVEFYANGGLVGTVTEAPYTFNWDAAPDGTYDLNVQAYDNEGLATTSNVVVVTVDNSL